MSTKKEFVLLVWGCINAIIFGLASILITAAGIFYNVWLMFESRYDTTGYNYNNQFKVSMWFVNLLATSSILTVSLIVSIVTLAFSTILIIGILKKNAVMVKTYYCYGIVTVTIIKTIVMINVMYHSMSFYGYLYFVLLVLFFIYSLVMAIRGSCMLCKTFKATMDAVPKVEDFTVPFNI